MGAISHAVVPSVDSDVERQTLDLGHLGSRGGPIATLPDGTMLWITTGPEAPYTIKAMWPISRLTLRRSTDGGKSWGEARDLLHGTKDYALLSHCLKRSASGALVHIFVRYGGYDHKTGSAANSLCEAFVHRSLDDGKTWTDPVRLETGERYIGDVLSLEQLHDGRLVYPFAYLTETKAQFACSALYSDDDGLTWKRSPSKLEAGGGGFESGASEPTVVELPDGRLWMLIRAQTGYLWESYSTDRGENWSPAKPSCLPSSNAPATALRLHNGDIAVAWNNHVQSNYARQSLVVALTRDGRSFRAMREIDYTDYPDNDDERALHVTYPYLTETRDGRIAISYNKGNWMRHNRPAFARVSPQWLQVRSETVDFRNGRVGWHTVNPGPKHSAAVERYTTDPESGRLSLEIEQARDQSNPAGIVRNLPMIADGEVKVTAQLLRSEAYLLFGDTLLNPQDVSECCVRVRLTNEQAFVAAGTPQKRENNRRSTEFHYSSHSIRNETPYPAPLKAGETLVISVKYQAAQRKAHIRINDGPTTEVTTGEILGLSYIGLFAGKGGALRILSIRTDLN
jgi:predicted neuraminidase